MTEKSDLSKLFSLVYFPSGTGPFLTEIEDKTEAKHSITNWDVMNELSLLKVFVLSISALNFSVFRKNQSQFYETWVAIPHFEIDDYQSE